MSSVYCMSRDFFVRISKHLECTSLVCYNRLSTSSLGQVMECELSTLKRLCPDYSVALTRYL